MGFLKGGTADKLGNRYEGRWVVQQLLYLLLEQLRSVQIEAIGEPEAGVDLWVSRLDNIREAQQCKAFNGDKNYWSISDLSQREVITKAYAQLTRDPHAEFSFVSSVLATELEDLRRTASDSHDADLFFKHCVEGKPRQRKYNLLCRALDLDSSDSAAQKRLFDFLRRVHVYSFQEDRSTKDRLEFLASVVLEADTPTSAVAALADIAQNNLHRDLSAPLLVQLLEPYAVRVRARHADHLITSRCEELRTAFIESIKPQLAAGHLIKRKEADDVLEILNAEARPDAIIVHGSPGLGKSGVLFQLEESLRESGILTLAVRFDRQPPTELSTAAYGKRLGLRTSPVTTLCDLAAGQQAVLILDQLDALRWTNAHAEQGLDICKALLREVQSARSVGAKIDIILACRTHDLESDPEIRSWLSNDRTPLRLAKVEVQPLSVDVVREHVTGLGVDPDLLAPAQLRLLGSVQRLAMWIEIVRTESTSPVFDSSTQLMRHFWANRRRILERAGCDAVRREEVLKALVEYMEANACLAAPESVLGQDQTLRTELQTSGVLMIRDHSVTFGHQSNLDFLVAEKAISTMRTSGLTVVQWLGNRESHSLFRREQLRQVLFLLADEDHPLYLETVRELLATHDIRFHLRQLAIETLGQIRPIAATFEFVQSLLEDQKWKEPAQLHVVKGNDHYVEHLIEQGLLLPILLALEPETWSVAALWLASVSRTSPQLVKGEVERVVQECAEWLPRVELILGRGGIDEEAEDLFSLRLKCIQLGAEAPYVDWNSTATKAPSRAIRLYHAMVMGASVTASTGASRDSSLRLKRVDGASAMLRAAKKRPALTWNLLFPALRQLLISQRQRRQEWQEKEKTNYVPRSQRVTIPAGLRQLVLAAGRSLARRHPEAMLRRAQHPTIVGSRYLSALFVEVLAGLPTSHADQAIAWLLSKKGLLRCGGCPRKPRWSPARALIRRMSRHCSVATFMQLESELLRFHDPEEKKLASYWLRSTRHGIFSNGFLMGQYHLLPGLYETRRSLETKSRIGVLSCKFNNYPKHVFLRGITSGRGGFVRSPLDDDRRFERMSNRAWLKVMANKSTLSQRGRWRSAEGRSGWVESSTEMLSRSFGHAAQLDPERFAQLASSIPAGTHPDYISELLTAWSLTNPPSDISETARAKWCPASVESVNQALRDLNLSDDRNVAIAFCRLLRERYDLVITARIIERLVKYAAHIEPLPDELEVDCNLKASECSVRTLEQNAHNTVRAVAALAIASILWHRQDLWPQLRTVASGLIGDPHPAVRTAAIEICLPVLRISRREAFEWLVDASSSDLRVAASHTARRLFNFGFRDCADLLAPLVVSMMRSSNEEIAEQGAAEVYARSLFYGILSDDAEKALGGTTAQRKGVANVVGQLVNDPEYSERCRPALLGLLNDDVKEVRHAAARFFYDHDFLETPWAPAILTKFVKSKAYRDDDGHLLWRLKELPGSIDRFSEVVFAIVDAILHQFQTGSPANSSYWSRDGLIEALLRLYDRATGSKQSEVRQRCLDAWDALIEHRAISAWSLSRDLDDPSTP